MSVEIPEFAALELTYQCNHKCIFCSCPWESDAAYHAKEMTCEEWKTVVDTLISHGVKMFSLTGGEAIMRQDIKELINRILYICHIEQPFIGHKIHFGTIVDNYR